MSLATQKKSENIVEYVLFIWQMEDLVRAMYFDIDAISEFVRGFTPSEETAQEELAWFKNLIKSMKSERVEQRGHVSEIHELIFELNYLHNTLLQVIKDNAYIEAYNLAQPNIKEYQQKTDGKTTNDVELCLTALYGLLVLRLKKEVISNETQEAIQTFSNLMARLSAHYKKMKTGELNFSLN
ncbi:MAG: DUF4924 family protein [Flavobacteriales bacterium]